MLPLDRNISESTQRFQWVIPEDSVTFQQAERAPRLRPERGQGNIGRQKEKRAGRNTKTKRRWIGFDQVCKRKDVWKERKKVGVKLRSLKDERIRMWQGRRKDLETEREGVRVLDSVEILEFIPCSNQSPLTWQACDKLSQRLYI